MLILKLCLNYVNDCGDDDDDNDSNNNSNNNV
jgi:hypothetical protein